MPHDTTFRQNRTVRMRNLAAAKTVSVSDCLITESITESDFTRESRESRVSTIEIYLDSKIYYKNESVFQHSCCNKGIEIIGSI